MKLIVGLGNPGKSYQLTRHNIGFLTVDRLAAHMQISCTTTKYGALYGAGTFRNENIILAKPQTYMNLSGTAIGPMVRKLEILPEDIWVIQDDLDIAPGRFKIKVGGSSGGHRGIASLIAELGQSLFVRFKIGIGKPTGPIPIENYVLMPFMKHEIPLVDEAQASCAAAILYALDHPLSEVQTRFNQKQDHEPQRFS